MPETVFGMSLAGAIIGVAGFWALTAILFILCAIFIEACNPSKTFAAVVAVLLYVAALWVCDVPIFTELGNLSAATVYRGVGYYLSIGVGWMIVKWFFFTWKWRIRYIELRDGFLEQQRRPPTVTSVTSVPGGVPITVRVPLSEQLEFREYVRNKSPWGEHEFFLKRPRFSAHADRAVDWGMLWPFSMAGTLLGDGIRWLGRYISSALTGIMDRISSFHARGLGSDFENPK